MHGPALTPFLFCVSGSLAYPGAANCYGGYARIAAAVQKARAAGPTIVLNAGDELAGTAFSVVYSGNESWPFLNAIGFDAMVSHETREVWCLGVVTGDWCPGDCTLWSGELIVVSLGHQGVHTVQLALDR